MKRVFLRILIASVSLFSFVTVPPSATLAAVDPEVTVEGIVVSYNDKTVEIFSRGTTTKVPRSSAPKQLAKGDHLSVTFDLEKFKATLSK